MVKKRNTTHVPMLNGNEQLDNGFEEVTKKKIVLEPRTYLLDGPEGPQLIKADTPVQVSRYLLEQLGYSIEVANKKTLIDLLSGGNYKVKDISTPRQGAV